ncbi:hypothetical protein R3P38DRAFT_3170544 [Favolaschia claudopus]|uniref:Uncharacterized protein n=1 Tax=Favolaschia claudopus TaxID=2862362 RepID=A0AAW0DX10_9AGAR
MTRLHPKANLEDKSRSCGLDFLALDVQAAASPIFTDHRHPESSSRIQLISRSYGAKFVHSNLPGHRCPLVHVLSLAIVLDIDQRLSRAGPPLAAQLLTHPALQF